MRMKESTESHPNVHARNKKEDEAATPIERIHSANRQPSAKQTTKLDDLRIADRFSPPT